MFLIGGDDTRTPDRPIHVFRPLYVELDLQLVSNRFLSPVPDQPLPLVPEDRVARYLNREC